MLTPDFPEVIDRHTYIDDIDIDIDKWYHHSCSFPNKILFLLSFNPHIIPSQVLSILPPKHPTHPAIIMSHLDSCNNFLISLSTFAFGLFNLLSTQRLDVLSQFVHLLICHHPHLIPAALQWCSLRSQILTMTDKAVCAPALIFCFNPISHHSCLRFLYYSHIIYL